MRRLALSIVGCMSLGGCMRIYADSELPDIKLEWNSGGCELGNELRLSIVDLDEGTVTRFAAPCTDGKLTLEDIDRKLYRIDGALVANDGTVFSTASSEADLRNGFNQDAFLYFEESRLRVAWTFDMGATCESLEIDTIAIDFDAQGYSYSLQTSCDIGVYVGAPYGQGLSLKLRGISRRKTVAASPQTQPFEISFEEDVLDLGTLTLTPCGDSCPPGPQSL